MDGKAKITEMESESIPKLILKYSSVTFCALLFSALYNITDTLFVSRGVGDDAAAGISVVFPFMMLQTAIAQTIGGGAATIVSRLLGGKDYKNAADVTISAMTIFYVSAVIISIICLLLQEPILRLFGATSEIMPYAKKYFTVIALGNIFSTGFSSIIRAEGKMKYALLIWLIPTGANIILDYLFIYIFHLGVIGAALGTVGGQFISFMMSVLFFAEFSCQNFGNIKNMKFSPKTAKEIILLGLPVLIQTGSMSILFAVINKFLSMYSGTQGVTAFAYISKIVQFAIVPYSAVSQAISPIISYNLGAGKSARIRRTVKSSLIICTVYSVAAFLLSFIISVPVLHIFTDSESVISYATNAVMIISPSLLFLPFINISGTFFQAIGDKRSAAAVNLSVVVFIFSAMLAATAITPNAVWAAVPIGIFISFLFSIVIYCRKRTA